MNKNIINICTGKQPTDNQVEVVKELASYVSDARKTIGKSFYKDEYIALILKTANLSVLENMTSETRKMFIKSVYARLK